MKSSAKFIFNEIKRVAQWIPRARSVSSSGTKFYHGDEDAQEATHTTGYHDLRIRSICSTFVLLLQQPWHSRKEYIGQVLDAVRKEKYSFYFMPQPWDLCNFVLVKSVIGGYRTKYQNQIRLSAHIKNIANVWYDVDHTEPTFLTWKQDLWYTLNIRRPSVWT
jgi:hypothetical protein